MWIKKIVSKYQCMPKQVKAFFWFAFCNIVQKCISFITTPFLTRILSIEEYGKYQIYNSWQSIIIIIATLNLFQGVFNTGITRDFSEEKDKFVSSMQGLSTTCTLVLFFVYFPFRSFFNSLLDLDTTLMIFMFLYMLFVPSYYYWAANNRFKYNYKSLVIVSILVSTLSSVISLFVAANCHDKVTGKIVSSVIVEVIFYGAIYLYNVIKGKTFFSNKIWRYGLIFNLPLIPHYLSSIVLNQADRIMIDNLIGEKEAGLYSLAYGISILMTVIISAINDSFVPYSYQALREGQFQGLKKNTTFLLFFVLILCTSIMCVGPELILLLGGKDYLTAKWVIPPVAVSIFFKFLYPLFGNIEFYYKKRIYTTIASTVGAILNIILNYLFIPKYGYIAAAYTTLICYICFALAHFLAYRRIIKTEVKKTVYELKFFALSSVIILFLLGTFTMIYDFAIIRYSLLLICLLLCIIYRKKIFQLFKRDF